MTWHVLDIRPVWVKEFASALCGIVPTIGWIAELSWTGALNRRRTSRGYNDGALDVRLFPLQRGYARPILRDIMPTHRWISAWLRERCQPELSVLICCQPFYAPIAEVWPGPVVYYATDLSRAYASADREYVNELETRICRVADLVCPNSERIARCLIAESGCPVDRVEIVPNATRSSSVLASTQMEAAELPSAVRHIRRPIAGVIGNLGSNMDWVLLNDVVAKTPWLHWLFVGPTAKALDDPQQSRARALLERQKRVFFAGQKPYGELKDYARAIDVAVLPYRMCEPTYSGSSTRFYEHLAACRPMLATPAFEELLHKTPLVKMTSTPQDMIAALHSLRTGGFRDGIEDLRWQVSRGETWDARAAAMVRALHERTGL